MSGVYNKFCHRNVYEKFYPPVNAAGLVLRYIRAETPRLYPMKLPSRALLTAAGLLLTASPSFALTWNVGGPTDNWSTGGADTNWTGGVTWTNGNVQAAFGGTNGEAITVSTVTTNEILFNNTGTAYNLSGGTITINSGVATNKSIDATADATISSNIIISGAQTWAVASGKTLTLGNINAAAVNTDMGFAGKGSYIINGSIGNVRTVYLNGASGDTTNVTFTQANTFTGNLWLGYVAGSSTTLNFSDVNQLGSGAGTNFIAIQNAATLNYTGTGSQSVTGRDLYWNAGTATISIANANANLTLGATGGARNQNFTKTGSGTLTLNSTATITGGSLTVNGGTLVVQSANSGTGTTTVTAGKLMVNNTTGSGLGSGTVSVSGGTLLGGTGTISGGALSVSSDATLQGGAGAASGTLTINNNVTLSSGSIIQLALGSSGTHSTLAFNGTESFDANQKFTFLDLGATATSYDNLISGVTTTGSTAGWTITNAGWLGTFNYDGAGNIDLVVSAVPEPSTYGLIGAGALAGVAFVRRRRHAGKAA